jgi:hypothetical protein
MISGVSNTASYLRSWQTGSSSSMPTAARSATQVTADAGSDPDAKPPADARPDVRDQSGISVSQFVRLIPTGAMIFSPENIDGLATKWLDRQNGIGNSTVVGSAPQNIHAQIKVGGEVIATLYNSGLATVSGTSAAQIDSLVDPTGLDGPELAQWRADAYAEALGGTVERAPTAMTQAEWTSLAPTSSYTREQLDQAIANIRAASQRLMIQTYAPSPSRSRTTLDQTS